MGWKNREPLLKRWSNRIIFRKFNCFTLMLLLVVIFMLLYAYLHNTKAKNEILKPSHLNKYVTFSCGNGGRLGNQFWPLFSIWSVGQTLGRRLYIDCDNVTMEMINHIRWIFPKTGGILLNRTEKYLKIHNYYTQNALYISQYRKQIDGFLEFGGAITDLGEKIIARRNISVNNVICAHIRQSDFKSRGWTKSYEDCLASVRYVARKQLNRTLFVMGDEKDFMNRMVTDLVKSGDVAKDSFYSNYTRAEDLYLSMRLCKTFVLTSEGSTFGFWLAWLAGEHSDVYYLNEYRTGSVPKFDAQFPLPWIPINVTNGVVV